MITHLDNNTRRYPRTLQEAFGPHTSRVLQESDTKQKPAMAIKQLTAKVLSALAVLVTVSGCGGTDADIASRNLSKAADQFEVTRRIVFYNGITGGYMLTIEGLCSLGNFDSQRQLSVTCKTGASAYKKHFLGLSDNVTYFVEQMEPMPVSTYHYRVIFKPQSILPNIDFEGSLGG